MQREGTGTSLCWAGGRGAASDRSSSSRKSKSSKGSPTVSLFRRFNLLPWQQAEPPPCRVPCKRRLEGSSLDKDDPTLKARERCCGRAAPCDSQALGHRKRKADFRCGEGAPLDGAAYGPMRANSSSDSSSNSSGNCCCGKETAPGLPFGLV
ncbi:hypothetical protein Emag_004343 [Eimeria magna]